MLGSGFKVLGMGLSAFGFLGSEVPSEKCQTDSLYDTKKDKN